MNGDNSGFKKHLPTSGAIQKGVPTEVFLRSRVLVSWAETPATKQKQIWLQICLIRSISLCEVCRKQASETEITATGQSAVVFLLNSSINFIFPQLIPDRPQLVVFFLNC